MKQILILTTIFILNYFPLLSQNVGIGTTSPTNKLHIIGSGGFDPLRIEGLNMFLNEEHILVLEPSTGIVRYMHIDSLSNINTALIDSLILTHSDTLYSFITDSALKDSTWIKQLDSLLNFYGDTIYFNDTSFSLYRDSLLSDSLFIDSLISLLNPIDTDIDSVTFFNDTIYIYENSKVISTHINTSIDTVLIDSLILAHVDTLYSFITDSALKDSTWIKQLDSLLNFYGDTIYFNDTSFSLYRDSLLGDSLFIDSLISLLDSIDTDVDSANFINDTLTIFENSDSVKVRIPVSTSTFITINSNSSYNTFPADVIFANAISASFSIEIPDPSLYSGRKIIIKKIDNTSNTITISDIITGGTLMDGGTSQNLSNPYQKMTFMSDGATWWTISE